MVPLSPVDVTVCLSGRELSEPVPSPDGQWVLFGFRSAGRSGLGIVPAAGGPERLLSVDPPPALGRGLGGGCIDWLPDGTGFVYAASDGQVWVHYLDGSRRRVTALEPGREVSSPRVAGNGASLAYVVDLAEARVTRVDDPTSDRVVSSGWDFVMDPDRKSTRLNSSH